MTRPKQKSSDCVSPYWKRHKTLPHFVSFPCGQCYPCKTKRVLSWTFRLEQELKQSDSAHFITFTYQDIQLPLTPSLEFTLDKTHFQKFMKRLRRRAEKDFHVKKIRYFCAGEYGGKTGRPHYHAIIFNADINHIETEWKYGKIHRGEVTSRSIMYTMKYILKERGQKTHDQMPEFQLMSKGLGQGYLSQDIIDYHHRDLIENNTIQLPGGPKQALPRYYKNKIYTDEEKLKIAEEFSKIRPVFNHDLQQSLIEKSQNKLRNENKNRDSV